MGLQSVTRAIDTAAIAIGDLVVANGCSWHHVDMNEGEALEKWREAMRTFLSSRESLSDWQDQRFALAHQIGGLLSGRFGLGEPIDASVLYGVYVAGLGVVYVGQTGDAARRLYDLAVGESHHLAATVPPELWERVVVVEWRTLLAEVSEEQQAVIDELPPLERAPWSQARAPRHGSISVASNQKGSAVVYLTP